MKIFAGWALLAIPLIGFSYAVAGWPGAAQTAFMMPVCAVVHWLSDRERV